MAFVSFFFWRAFPPFPVVCFWASGLLCLGFCSGCSYRVPPFLFFLFLHLHAQRNTQRNKQRDRQASIWQNFGLASFLDAAEGEGQGGRYSLSGVFRPCWRRGKKRFLMNISPWTVVGRRARGLRARQRVQLRFRVQPASLVVGKKVEIPDFLTKFVNFGWMQLF